MSCQDIALGNIIPVNHRFLGGRQGLRAGGNSDIRYLALPFHLITYVRMVNLAKD
jgi:hypothetical protein